MSEQENFEIIITGDASDAISSASEAAQSFESINEIVNDLRQTINGLKSDVESTQFGRYAQDMKTQFSLAEDSLSRIVRLKRQSDSATSETVRSNSDNLLRTELQAVRGVIDDFRESFDSISSLLSNIGSGMAVQFIQGIRDFAPSLSKDFAAVASNRARRAGTTSDEELIRLYKNQRSYRDSVAQLRKQDAALFSDANMDHYLRGLLTSSVSNIHRNRFVDWAGDRRRANNVRDLLPKAFSSISLAKNPVADRTVSMDDFGHRLTPNERAAFERLFSSNPYIQEEARRANLIAVKNGIAMMNKQATRGHINAFAGMIAQMFETGARGLPSYGIDSIENPAFLEKIEQKTNKMIVSARKVADELSSAYEWLDPGHYQSTPAGKSGKNNWSTIGRVTTPSRRSTMEFLEIDFANIDSKGNVVMTNGQTVHRYTPVSSSVYQRALSRQNGADPFVHNGRNSNEIFISIPHKELEDPELSQERRREITSQIASTISKPIYFNGEEYVYTTPTKTHLAFTKRKLRDSFADPTFFTNGENRRTFDDPESFGKAMSYMRLDRTDTEDIRDIYGSDLSDVKVVIADMKKLTGLDGQNFISKRLSPESFQGRQHGGKATYSVFDPKALFEIYKNRIDANGNLVIPGAGLNGEDLVIPSDVDIIEDFSNIKTNHRYQGLSSAEIAKLRSREIRDYGIGAKTTYSEAFTQNRYLSSQIANSLVLNEEAIAYFDDVFYKELEMLDDPSSVIDLLFSGKDKLSQDVQRDRGLLNSREAQTRIQEYRDSLLANRGKGNILLPRDAAQYLMLAASITDTFNNALVAAGYELTGEEAAASVGEGALFLGSEKQWDDTVFPFKNDSLRLYLSRNPATFSGNVLTTNAASNPDAVRAAIMLGLDPHGIYVNPKASFLPNMQGPDEDGDTLDTIPIGVGSDPVFSRIIEMILRDTAARTQEIFEKSGRTREEQAERAKTNIKSAAKDGHVYSLDNPEDQAEFIVSTHLAAAKMGLAAAVSRDAYQYSPTQSTARAMLDAESHYDVDSNGLAKRMEEWTTSQDEWDLLRNGSPFQVLYNWALKSRTDDANGSTPSSFDFELFKRRNIDKVNFPSVHSGNALSSALSLFIAKQIKGLDVSGGFNWDEIFGSLDNPYAADSKAGQFMTRMRELRKQHIQGEFLFFDSSLVDELDARSQDALNEITARIMADDSIEPSKKRAAIQKEYDSIGGTAYANLRHIGLTRDNIEANPELKKIADEYVAQYGNNIWGQGQEYVAETTPGTIDQVARDLRQKQAQAKEKAEELTRQLRESEKTSDQIVVAALETQMSEEDKATVRNAQSRIEQLRKERDIDRNRYTQHDYDAVVDEMFDLRAAMDQFQGEETDAEYVAMQQRIESLSAKAQEIEESLKKPSYEELISKEEDKIAALVPGYRDSALNAANINQQAQQYTSQARMYEDQSKTMIDYMRAISGFTQFYEEANSYNLQLKKSYRSKEAKDEGMNDAERLWGKLTNNMRYFTSRIDEMLKLASLPDSDKAKLQVLRSEIESGTRREFASEAIDLETGIRNNLQAGIRSLEKDYDPAEEKTLASLNKKIDNLRSMRKMFEKLGMIEAAEKAGKAIDEFDLSIKEYRGKIYANEAEDNEKLYSGMSKFDRERRRRYDNSALGRQLIANENDYAWYANQKNLLSDRLITWQKRKDELVKAKDVNGDAYKIAEQEIGRLSSAIKKCQSEMDSLNGVNGALNAGMLTLGRTVSNVVTQFGYQLFRNAINEMKQFVVEYDAAMTEIQMVTLKTDEEIEGLGDGLLDKAIDLKAPVADVYKAATSLYRQGLDDNTVNSRLEDVMKFSTTAKVEATDAIKLITVAMSGEMVDSAQEAMDVVSALSDNAATEAGEITKGLQKSMAAAQAVGVTYEELVSMLTVITSKTQLSGSVAGTTMRNIMSRLSRVGANELIIDENGNAISSSAQAQILKSIGVDMYDEQGLISAFKILSDIGNEWSNLSDAKKNQVAYALGGTEQFSNVAALMQGFSEKDEFGNNLLDRYLNIANQSSGVTDEKYLHYTESLDSAMANLNNTFDSFIDSVVNGTGAIQGIIGFFADAFEGFSKFNRESGGVVTGLLGILGAIGLIAAAIVNWPVALVSGIVGGLGLIGVGLKNLYEDPPTITEKSEQINNHYNEIIKAVKEAQEINNRRVDGVLSDEDTMALKKAFTNLNSLGVSSFDASKDLDALAKSADNTSTALKNVEDAARAQQASETGALLSGLVDKINEYVEDPKNVQTELVDVTKAMPGGDGRSILEYANDYYKYRILTAKDKSMLLGKDHAWLESNKHIATSTIYGQAAGEFSEFLLAAGQPIDAKVYTTGVDGPIEFDKLKKFNDRNNAVLTPNDFPNVELMEWLFGYSQNRSLVDALLYGNEFKPGSKFKSELETVLSLQQGVSDTGLISAVSSDIEAKINDAYASWDGEGVFDVSSYMYPLYEQGTTNITPNSIALYAKTNVPNAYAAYEKSRTIDDNGIVQLTGQGAVNAIYNASLLNGADGQNYALERIYKAFSSATGYTIEERLKNAAQTLLSGTENGWLNKETIETLMSDEKHADIAKAFYQMYELDKNENIVPKKGVDNDEIDMFTNMVASKYITDSSLGTYRSNDIVRLSGVNTFTELDNATDRWGAWNKLSVVDAMKDQLQEDFIETIGGKDVAYRYLNREFSEDGEFYYDRKIGSYGLDTPVFTEAELLSYVEKMLSSIDENGGSAYPYIDGLPKEMLSSMYGVVDGLEEYIEAISPEEESRTKTPEEIRNMRSDIETNLMLARVPYGDYSSEITNQISSLRGDDTEQNRAALDAIMNQAKYERGFYAYDNILSGDADARDYELLSSALGDGYDENTIRKLMETDEGKKLIDQTLRTNARKFTYVIEEAIMAMLSPEALALLRPSMDAEEIEAAIGDYLTDGALSIIRATGATVDADGISIPTGAKPGEYSPASAYSYARATYSGPSDEYRMLNYFVSALKDEKVISGDQNIDGYLSSDTAAAKENWSNFYAEHPNIMLAKEVYEDGAMSRDDFMARLQAEMYGNDAKGEDYYSSALNALFSGAVDEDGSTDWEAVASNYQTLMSSDFGNMFLSDIEELEGGTDLIAELSETLKKGTVDTERYEEALKRITDSMGSRQLSQLTKYDKANKKIVETFDALAAGGSDAADAYNDLMNSTRNLDNANWALKQYKSGSRSDKVTDILSGQFGLDSNALKRASKADAEAMIETMEMAYDEQFEILKKNFDYNFSDISDYVAQAQANTGGEFQIKDYVVNGKVNISALLKAFSDAGVIVDQTWAAVVKAMAASATFGVTADGDQVKLDLTNIAGTGSGYYGGGGGSKKSSADKLVERLGHGKGLYEHQIKMVQYEQTKYENADELSNYGKMLEEELKIERAYLPVLESNIAALRNELDNVKKGSEDWYKLRDAILEAEEQYADINNTIEENEKKLEENHQAILKLHTDLEEMVVGEIELRIDAEKEMLDGSVSMQDIVLNAIKQRYQDEWDLIKQDIEKKKEALQQEKDLIDERLDARREAEDEAAKYEELAELKKQLSLISMDSTRTKDAAALRESIAELEKEIGWDIAEKEAENAKNEIQDQIDAYDDYVREGDEDLNDLLSDANNFAEEVNGVMKLNQAELFEWLKQNVKEYANSLDDAQKQMVQSWEATYKQMLGITDTYWDEVNAILSSKDTFLEYMKQSSEYIYASDDERAQLLYQWEEAYDAWQKAKKNDADYSHGDSGLGDYSGSEYAGSSSSSGSGGSSSSGTAVKDPDIDDTVVNSAPASRGPFFVSNSSSGKTGSSYDSLNSAMVAAKELAEWRGENVYVKDANGNLIYTYNSSGMATLAPGAGMTNPSTSSEAALPVSGWPESAAKTGTWYYKITENGLNVQGGFVGGFPTREAAQAAAASAVKYGQKYSTKKYLKGGVADYTGLAWLDGTPSEPERILSADQTRDFEKLVSVMDYFRNSGVSMDALRSMARWSSMINVPSSLSYIGGAAYQGNSANIGDIFVNITEAQISDDRDIEELANIVGQKFVKEIGKQGFNVSHYSF